jgi:hypothetical protein
MYISACVAVVCIHTHACAFAHIHRTRLFCTDVYMYVCMYVYMCIYILDRYVHICMCLCSCTYSYMRILHITEDQKSFVHLPCTQVYTHTQIYRNYLLVHKQRPCLGQCHGSQQSTPPARRQARPANQSSVRRLTAVAVYFPVYLTKHSSCAHASSRVKFLPPKNSLRAKSSCHALGFRRQLASRMYG